MPAHFQPHTPDEELKRLILESQAIEAWLKANWNASEDAIREQRRRYLAALNEIQSFNLKNNHDEKS